MEAALLASFLNTYLPKIWDNITKGNDKEEQLKQELKKNKLLTEITMMAAAIEDSESPGMERGTAQAVCWINTLRWLAQDIEDHIELFLHPGASESPNSACLTEDLMERIKRINEDQRTFYGKKDQGTLGAQVDQSVPYLPDYIVHKEEPLKELLELVQEHEEHQEDADKMKVITIVGFGGLGKTLRANQVYRSKDLDKQFDLREWFCAADMESRDILMLIRERLENRTKSSSAGTDVERIITCLQELRYFIVIDDMRSPVQWHGIISAFPKKLRSRIIVTTTRESVAENCRNSGGYVYKLLPLNRDHSLKLLVNGLPSISDSAAKDAEDLLTKCDGLPLALINLSQYFQGNGGLTRRTCLAACRRLGVYLVEKEELGKIRQLLVNKYTGLSDQILKACLLYFSVFPCNNQPRRNYLIRRWVAEGFVSQNDAITKFEDLMERNVIQAMEVGSNGKGKRCQPPGMLHEYILYKATSEKFVTMSPAAEGETNGFGSGGLTYVRRICLSPNNLVDYDLGRSIDLSIVRALEVSGKASSSILNFEEAGDNYKLLRVLELKECDTLNEAHLNNICDNLMLLRYLSLGGDIVRIPDTIENLKLLETLHMRPNITVAVPFELFLLPCLTHLLGKFQLYEDENIPEKKKKIQKREEKIQKKKEKIQKKNVNPVSSALQRLSGFLASEEEFDELMPLMKCLRKMKIWCYSGFTADGTLPKAIKAFIREGLNTGIDDRSLSVDFSECSNPFKDSDENLGRLTSLKLKGNMESFPRSLGTQVQGIEKLCLSSTSSTLRWVHIEEGVGGLTKLMDLKLCGDDLRNFAPDAQTQVPKNAPSVSGEKPPFRNLKRICFSVNNTHLPQPAILGYLPALKETRCSWKKAAKVHPQRPMLWFGAPAQAS